MADTDIFLFLHIDLLCCRIVLQQKEMKKRVILILFMALSSAVTYAQRYGAGTNLLGYANFLTLNAELSAALARKWSIALTGKYNPWTFNKDREATERLQNRQLTFAAGFRYWPWHIYSGWYVGVQGQYTKYSSGGIRNQATYEGDILGMNFNFGYALMLSRHWNIDFGGGLLVGRNVYDKYACPRCGKLIGKDKEKIYIAPNSLLIQFAYLF